MDVYVDAHVDASFTCGGKSGFGVYLFQQQQQTCIISFWLGRIISDLPRRECEQGHFDYGMSVLLFL